MPLLYYVPERVFFFFFPERERKREEERGCRPLISLGNNNRYPSLDTTPLV